MDLFYNIENPKEFILAGKAFFTVENPVSGNRFTFKVSKIKDKDNAYFVNVGSDYLRYRYIGNLYSNTEQTEFTFRVGKRIIQTKGEYPKSVQVFEHIIKHYMTYCNGTKLNFYHHQKCARCGRTLTTPDSIKSGFGPVCRNL